MPSPAPILDLIDAFRRSKVLFVAVNAGLFELLKERPNLDAVSIAEAMRWNADAGSRLLDACAALELIEVSDGRYRNTELAETYLVRSSPNTLSGYIRYSEKALYPLWGHLDDALREGTHRWAQTFGPMEGSLFDHFFQTEDAKRDFLAGMHGMGMLSSPAVVRAVDLSRFRRLADLGGATGHLAIAACQHYPELEAVVLDLPAVTPVTQEYVDAAGMAGRITCQTGDFFRDALPPADLYVLGRILHDWSEEKIRFLLRKLHDTGAALLICERLLQEDRRGPLNANLQSLSMLVCTEGKERTFREYEALLRDAGFMKVEFARTGLPTDAILAE